MKGIRTILGAIAAMALFAVGIATPAAAQKVQSVAGLNPAGTVVASSGVTIAGGDVTFTAPGQYVVVDAGGAGGASLGVQGTWSGALKVQWSDKAATGFQDGVAAAAGGSEVSSITANQQYLAPSYGRYLKIIATALASGSPVVTPVLATPRPGGAPAATPAGSNIIGDVGTASFAATCTTLTNPGTGGTYASGDLVANSAAAGSVTPLTCTVARYSGGPVTITKARILTSTTGVSNAQFYVHVFTGTPTVTNGNDGVFLPTASGHFCRVDVTLTLAFSDGADGAGVPVNGTSCTRVLSATQDVKVLLEARAAYAWTASQTYTVTLEGFN